MKKLILTAVITVGIVAGVGHVGMAQDQPAARPDFSGKWVFASSQPSGLKAFGDDFSIAQDATTLGVDSTGYRDSVSSTGASSETRFPIRKVYVLDGIEHAGQVIGDPLLTAGSAPVSGFEMFDGTVESISKATWVGRQLVIMTYDRIKITTPTLTPSVNVIRRTVRQALSMEGDGRLTVESLIVADPLPWGHEAPSPTPIRSIYKKG